MYVRPFDSKKREYVIIVNVRAFDIPYRGNRVYKGVFHATYIVDIRAFLTLSPRSITNPRLLKLLSEADVPLKDAGELFKVLDLDDRDEVRATARRQTMGIASQSLSPRVSQERMGVRLLRTACLHHPGLDLQCTRFERAETAPGRITNGVVQGSHPGLEIDVSKCARHF